MFDTEACPTRGPHDRCFLDRVKVFIHGTIIIVLLFDDEKMLEEKVEIIELVEV